MYKLNRKCKTNPGGGVTMLSGSSNDVATTASLVAWVRLGDTGAYDELVKRYLTRAVRIARSFIRDKDLGLAPGFAVVKEDLEGLKTKKLINRYEITPCR